MKKRLSPTERHNIVQEFGMGASASSLADRYSISINYVYVLVKRSPKSVLPSDINQKLPQPKKHRYARRAVSKPVAEPKKPSCIDQGEVVRRHQDVRRGFIIPKNKEVEYIELLKQGLSRQDAHDKIWKSII